VALFNVLFQHSSGGRAESDETFVMRRTSQMRRCTSWRQLQSEGHFTANSTHSG